MQLITPIISLIEYTQGIIFVHCTNDSFCGYSDLIVDKIFRIFDTTIKIVDAMNEIVGATITFVESIVKRTLLNKKSYADVSHLK